MVDGETYECTKRFCYLGDTLGGVDLAATARINNKMDEVLRAFAISDIQRFCLFMYLNQVHREPPFLTMGT